MRTSILGWLALVFAWPAVGEPAFPLAPSVAERRMALDPFEVVSAAPTPSGVAGARKLVLRFPADGAQLEVKWKAAPARSGEGWNNVPRKELAAYAVQQWLLTEADYVVPTTTARCIPLDVYAAVDPSAHPTFPDTACVFGVLSLWLHGVRGVDRVIDEDRLARDAVYARHLGNVNLLAYLIEHRDGRKSNFLISTNEADPRVFSVDNGIAFGGTFFNFLAPNLSKLRVPVPRESLERLRGTTQDQVRRLGVLAQLELDEGGTYVPAPHGPNLDPEKGTRRAGRALQLGLTDEEIEDVAERLEELLLDAEHGEIEIR